MQLIYFVLAAYGLTQILLYGSIFNKIRPSRKWLHGFGKLFHCPMCMGFWVGVFLWGINRHTELFTFDYTIANFFICGWVGAGTSYILSMIVGDEGIRVDKGTQE